MTGFIEKVKEAIKPDSHHTSQPEGTHGHHNTRTANAADPRIDSDRDHRAAGAHDGSYTTGNNYTLGSNNRGVDGPATRTDGPHNSNVLNKADPRVDSDRDHSRNLGANPSGTATTGTHNTTGHTGTTGLSGTTGTHAGTSHTTGTGFGSTGTTGANRTDGPHNSNLLNKADPRVDSDRDGSRNLGANPSGTATTGTYGSSGTTGLHSSTGTTGANRTDGPHNSNLLNKADPRVDSDRDHSRNLGANPSGTATTGTYGSTGTHGLSSGTTGTHSGTHNGTTGGNRTAGPHNSDLLNKVDPRVDSDRDGSRNLGLNSNTSATTGNHPTGLSGSQGTHGTHGTTHLGSSTSGVPEGTAGPHSSRAANAADPRIDSDLDNRGTTGTAGGRSAVGNFGSAGTHTGAHTGAHTGSSGLTGSTGTHTGTHTGAHTGTSGLTGSTGTHATGPAPNTAGPHKSDMLNKIDPRVDSDLDGSKTYGGDKTYSRS